MPLTRAREQFGIGAENGAERAKKVDVQENDRAAAV